MLPSKETLLQKPLVNQDLQPHPVLDGEGGEEVHHAAGVGVEVCGRTKLIV
jgi:hypothetical protein